MKKRNLKLFYFRRVSPGMAYLEFRRLLHRDLVGRNVFFDFIGAALPMQLSSSICN